MKTITVPLAPAMSSSVVVRPSVAGREKAGAGVLKVVAEAAGVVAMCGVLRRRGRCQNARALRPNQDRPLAHDNRTAGQGPFTRCGNPLPRGEREDSPRRYCGDAASPLEASG